MKTPPVNGTSPSLKRDSLRRILRVRALADPDTPSQAAKGKDYDPPSGKPKWPFESLKVEDNYKPPAEMFRMLYIPGPTTTGTDPAAAKVIKWVFNNDNLVAADTSYDIFVKGQNAGPSNEDGNANPENSSNV